MVVSSAKNGSDAPIGPLTIEWGFHPKVWSRYPGLSRFSSEMDGSDCF